MAFPPVVERELRVALRKRPPTKARIQAVLLAAGLSAFFLMISLLEGRSSGRSLHTYLFLAGLYTVVIVPARMCIGLLSEERRNQTLQLLALTGMRPVQMFLQKVSGGILMASCDFLALAPFLALPFLAGGVSFELFVATIVCLPLLLLLSIAVTTLASAICIDDTAVLVCALLMGGFLSLVTLLPYSVGKALTGVAPYSAHWLALSPGYAALLVGSKFSYGPAVEFWPAAGCMLVWAVICFVLADIVLKRHWRALSTSTVGGWRERYENWLQGSEQWRRKLSAHLLEKNPFQWLVQRERRPLFFATANVAALLLLWLLGWLAWPKQWLSTGNFYLTAMLLLMIVQMHEQYAAARRTANDRREGHFELLLTTPITPAEILEGQIAGLRRQFRPLRLALFGLYVLMSLGGLLIRPLNLSAMLLYYLIWSLFFFWILRSATVRLTVMMWVALNYGHATAAWLRTMGMSGWQWFWIFFNFRVIVRSWGKAAQFPSGTSEEWLMVVVLGLVMFVAQAVRWRDENAFREHFINFLRPLAQQPVPDPNDPRLKKWKDFRKPPPKDPEAPEGPENPRPFWPWQR